MKRIIRAAFLAATIALVGLAGSASAGQPADLHCPGYNDPAYVKTDNPGNDTVLEEGTEACVKGGQAEPTSFTADGVTSLGEYLPGKWDVSYVVVYSTPQPTPTPTPSPSSQPTPEPSSSPSTPPATPTVSMPPTDTDGETAARSSSGPDWLFLFMFAVVAGWTGLFFYSSIQNNRHRYDR